MYVVSALSGNLTINAPTGSVTEGSKIIFRILDDGTSRRLNWNGIYRPIGVITPEATVAGKLIYVGTIYNQISSKWDIISVSIEF